VPEDLPDFPLVLASLNDAGVRYVLIGGLALVAQGSAHVTRDIDVCYSRDRENLRALAEAIAPLHPQLRTVAGPVMFPWDERTLRGGANFTLTTTAGDVDLLGDVAGVPSFQALWDRSAEMEVFGIRVRVASVDDLLSMKRAAGRPKDQAHIIELEGLQNLRSQGSTLSANELGPGKNG
jgi:predicted nucleotidyltransferase